MRRQVHRRLNGKLKCVQDHILLVDATEKLLLGQTILGLENRYIRCNVRKFDSR
jgi:hypothetical protein